MNLGITSPLVSSLCLFRLLELPTTIRICIGIRTPVSIVRLAWLATPIPGRQRTYVHHVSLFTKFPSSGTVL